MTSEVTNPGTTAPPVPQIPLAWLPKWLPFLLLLAAVISASAVGEYRLTQVETRMVKLEDGRKGITRSLGAMQLDIALLCTEAVRAKGGDPLVQCRTARGVD